MVVAACPKKSLIPRSPENPPSVSLIFCASKTHPGCASSGGEKSNEKSRKLLNVRVRCLGMNRSPGLPTVEYGDHQMTLRTEERNLLLSDYNHVIEAMGQCCGAGNTQMSMEMIELWRSAGGTDALDSGAVTGECVADCVAYPSAADEFSAMMNLLD